MTTRCFRTKRICLISAVVFFTFAVASCGSSSLPPVKQIPIDVPGESERSFGEKRDFYVIGYFPEPLGVPGDVRIELFRGAKAEGELLRSVQSHVDPETGVTPLAAIEQNYSFARHDSSHTLLLAPDLIKEPGGIANPDNKVVVTREYYAGIIFGGATKDFELDYRDAQRLPLVDLTQGEYTVKVTGLTGELAGRTNSVRVRFGLTHAALGRFSPQSQLAKLEEFSRIHGFRLFRDPLPGNFWVNGQGCEIDNRWRAINAMEVVNALPGTTIDTVTTAQNDLLIYNMKPSAATIQVEVATLALHQLIDSPNTVYHYYNIGEPVLEYTDYTGTRRDIGGTVDDVRYLQRLILNRAEIKNRDGRMDDNRYIIGDSTPREVDPDLSDGVRLNTAQECDVFGVVTPIPTTVTPGQYKFQYTLDNLIKKIHFTITRDGGPKIEERDIDVNLVRFYDPGDLANGSPSMFEFKFEFEINTGPGLYHVDLFGVDAAGVAVPGTVEAFVAEIY